MNKSVDLTKQYLAKTKYQYLIIFGSIFLITVFAQIAIQYFIYKNKSHSHMINIAGRQRMLSQRIAWFANKVNLNQTHEGKTILKQSIELFSSSHQDLRQGNPKLDIEAPLSDDLQSKYEALTPLQDQLTIAATCILNQCSSKENQLKFINLKTNEFLRQMNDIVFESSRISQQMADQLSYLELFFFALIILTMVIEVFLILLPLNDRLQKVLIQQFTDKDKQERLYHLADMGEMSSGILHEINNFLNIISVSNQVIEKKIKAGNEINSIRPQVDKIFNGTSRIEEMCKSMSSLSRISYLSDFNLSDLLQDIKNMTQDRIQNFGAELKITILNDGKVRSNKSQISQILINLLINACHAVENEDVKEIELNMQIGQDKLIFSVSDTGKGVSPEIKDKIFDAYFTTKENGRGTGLGLSLSKKIAQALGGDLKIDQSKAKTTFLLEVENKIYQESALNKSA